MIFARGLVIAITAAARVAGAPSLIEPEDNLVPRQGTQWYSKYWANDKADLTYDNRAGGVFAVTWDEPDGGNFVVGKGKNPGVDMKFNYSGSFTPEGFTNSYLALYGWAYNPTAEYYVIENFGVHHPADHVNSSCFGHFESDGGTYEVWRKFQTNSAGQVLFPQYWAVRTKKRIGGTITTGNFFAAWEAAGLEIGRLGEMVLGVEGQWGKGHATLTAGVYPTTTIRETATPTTRTNVPIRTNTCTARLDI
jgi:endo-1,4-beta-xylanase